MAVAVKPVVGRIVACFGPYRRHTIFIALGVLAASTLGLANPLIVKAIIDRALPERDLVLLGKLALAMIGITLVSGAIDTGETFLTTLVGQRVMRDLRTRLYSHLQRMPLSFFTETRSGEILSRLSNDVSGVQETVTSTASQILQDVIMAVTTLALMFTLDWKLTLICLSMLPLFVYPTRKAQTVRRKLSKEAQAKIADLSSVLEETLSISGSLLTKTFGRQRREIERFDTVTQELMRIELRRAMLSQIFWVSIQTFWAVAPALIYYFGGREVARGGTAATLGGLVAFVALQNRLFFPIGRLFGVQVQLQGAFALFERIFEYLDMVPAIADKPGAPALVVTRGEVCFEHVRFHYVEGRTTLDDVSFVARPGELTALVGPSGAGKTTVTYLIPRLYDVVAGAVRIDGTDVRDATQASVADAVGVVTQETFLFHSTVKENLRYARPDATDEELIDAARAAQIHERILELPEGYDTIVGERGYKLSGGERQRIAIARVLLKRAAIVILDEATSALDTASERLIQAALEPLTRGRTTLAIAHRLSTVQRANQILVLDHGKIVERGTHQELYARGGLYTKLVDEQLGRDDVGVRSAS